MNIVTPQKSQLGETIRVMKAGIIAIEAGQFKGQDSRAVAEVLLFLRGLSQDAQIQYDTLPDDKGESK